MKKIKGNKIWKFEKYSEVYDGEESVYDGDMMEDKNMTEDKNMMTSLIPV